MNERILEVLKISLENTVDSDDVKPRNIYISLTKDELIKFGEYIVKDCANLIFKESIQFLTFKSYDKATATCEAAEWILKYFGIEDE